MVSAGDITGIPPTAKAIARRGDMPWLSAQRARLFACGTALVWMALIGKSIWLFTGAHNHTGDVFGEDFVSFWAASRLVLSGHPADAYVQAMHRLAELPVLSAKYEAFYYPPSFLLLCAPLALLPFFAALAVFQMLSGVAFLWVIRSILRRRWAFVAALAFPVVPLNIVPGQNGFLTTAIIGGGLLLLDRRPRLAGIILGLIVVKPHLALALPIALLASRRWRVLCWAAASALAELALSWLLFGSECWANFLANGHAAEATLELGRVGFARMDSAFAVARLAGSSIPAAYAVQALTVATAIGGLLWLQRRSPSAGLERSCICLASLLMTPFVLHYDMMLLALPLAWMLREWLDQGFPAWGKPVLLAVFCAPTAYLWTPVPFGPPAALLFGACLLSLAAQDRRSLAPASGAVHSPV